MVKSKLLNLVIDSLKIKEKIEQNIEMLRIIPEELNFEPQCIIHMDDGQLSLKIHNSHTRESFLEIFLPMNS